MKFQRLIMNNFMRYKGKNEIVFSCQNNKNVTVILGDNTSGKTTIAQAFRFCLYGELMHKKGKKEAEYHMLNNDVLELMDQNSRAVVSVELEIVNVNKQYRLFREIAYLRNYPSYSLKESYRKVELTVRDGEGGENEDIIEIEKDKITEVINELFPKDLSQYFLFDGERWNDGNLNGVKENIKESVHKLTGLSAVKSSMNHLKDMGNNSVIRKFQANISGSGAIYESLRADIERNEYRIEKLKENIVNIERSVEYYQNEINDMEEFLMTNQSTEEMQKNYKHLEQLIEIKKKNVISDYKSLVNIFSDKCIGYFAGPMIKASLQILKNADLERKDIPHIRQSTIDYLLERKKCICGCDIKEGSKEYNELIDQRKYLPPAAVGSLLGEFERMAERTENRSEKFFEILKEDAENIKANCLDIEEKENLYFKMGNTMDRNFDFAEKRQLIRNYKEKLMHELRNKAEKEGQIQAIANNIEKLQRELDSLSLKTEQNNKWRQRIELAKEIYERFYKDFTRKEGDIFKELNEKIQINFEHMFNSKDKKIFLDKDYNIKMMYCNNKGLMEENNLSEGEKIARNFAFIVTIMEYSKLRKSDSGEDDTLPIVLDGPFSKLGEENIRLIAKVLPEIAEQVIIFMLDKDWKYTDMDNYVGEKYIIEKEADKKSAHMRRC